MRSHSSSSHVCCKRPRSTVVGKLHASKELIWWAVWFGVLFSQTTTGKPTLRESTTIRSFLKKETQHSQHTKHLPTRVTGYGSRHFKNCVTIPAEKIVYLEEQTVHSSINKTSSWLLNSLISNSTLELNSTGVYHVPRSNDNTTTDARHVTGVPVHGLFGVYSIPSGQLFVWVVSTESVYQAPLQHSNYTIERVKELHLIRIPNDSQPLSLPQRLEEQRQLSLLRQALKQHEWYFSSTQDFTRSIQQLMTSNGKNTKWWRRKHPFNETAATAENSTSLYPEERFFWNEPCLESFLHDPNDNPALDVLMQHAIPVTSAFVGVQRNLTVQKKQQSSKNRQQEEAEIVYDQLLISRRSRFRAGTRFTKRGADATGAVANYAETEQIIFVYSNNNNNNNSYDNTVPSAICSHVQTRGSIPLRWSSPTDIKTYRPRVRIGTDPIAQARAMQLHLMDQCTRFVVTATDDKMKKKLEQPGLILVNLIDKKSDQGRLGRAMDAVLEAVLEVFDNLPCKIQHVWFDFHKNVHSGKWDRLTSLLEQVQLALMEHGYFHAIPNIATDALQQEGHWAILKQQNGVIRTNCMDCLDRTNVVQSIFGRFILFQQLSNVEQSHFPLAFKTAFRKNPLSLPWANGEVALRLLWADNADAISRYYAGTPALKGDFVRTGKRTKKGALNDGMNSLQRYYLNNFLDADRQEGLDLLTGYHGFTILEEDENIRTQESSSLSFPFDIRGLTIQEAARQMKLIEKDSWAQTADDSDDDHVRIKQKKKSKNLKMKARVGQDVGAIRKRRHQRQPDLRWLPGDLQEQVRSRFSTNVFERDSDKLLAMEKRSQSELPWWVLADQEDEPKSAEERSATEVDGVLINNGGYLVAAFVAGTQAPLTMAAVVLGLASLALTTEKTKRDD